MHLYASECIKMFAKWIVQMFCARNCQRSGFLLHLNRLKCINMHRNASKCMQNELFLCFMHEISIWKIQFFWSKSANFFCKCSECINMHQNVSKCMQNELCKCFVYEIIKEVVFITFKQAKIDELLLSLRCGKPCSLNVI